MMSTLGPYLVIVTVVLIGVSIWLVQRRRAAIVVWAKVAAELELQHEPGSWKSPHELTGTVDGRTVRVWTHQQRTGEYSNVFTSYSVEHVGSGAELTITPHPKGFSLLGKNLGLTDTEVGNPEFDEKFLVVAAEPSTAATFLTPERQAAILAFFERRNDSAVGTVHITTWTRGIAGSSDAMLATLHDLGQLASLLDEPSASSDA